MADPRPNIWQLQSQGKLRSLVEALRYPDSEIRGRAAVALRTLDAVQALPALKEALSSETDPQAQKQLSAAINILDRRKSSANAATSDGIEGLIDALKSQQAQTVIAAARTLGTLGNRLAVEPLVILFNNPTSPPAVRLAAADALLRLNSAPAVVTLLGALRRDTWQARRNAAAVLGQIHAGWAVEPLAEALDDPHPVVRQAAAAALQRIGTADAIAVLRARFAPPPTA